MIVAYDHEAERCATVVTEAIRECNTEAVALDIALATARSIAEDIIKHERINIEANQAGHSRIQYTISLEDNPFGETDFWASFSEFRPRLTRAVRRLRQKGGNVSYEGI